MVDMRGRESRSLSAGVGAGGGVGLREGELKVVSCDMQFI